MAKKSATRIHVSTCRVMKSTLSSAQMAITSPSTVSTVRTGNRIARSGITLGRITATSDGPPVGSVA